MGASPVACVASSLYSAAPEARRHPESRDSIYDWRSTTMEQGAVTLVRNIAAAGCLPLVDPSGEILQTICEEHFLTEDSHKCLSVPTIATGVFRCVVAGSGVGYRTKASFESEKVTDVYGPSIGQCVTISDVQTVEGIHFLRGTAGWLPMHDPSGELPFFEKLSKDQISTDDLKYCPNAPVDVFRCVVEGLGVGYRRGPSLESEKVTDVYGPSIGQCVIVSKCEATKGVTHFLKTVVRGNAAWLPTHDPSGELQFFEKLSKEQISTEDLKYCPNTRANVFRCVIKGPGIGYRRGPSFESEKVTDVYGPSIGQCVTISDVQ